MNPNVSVIIPVFNRPQKALEAINSVLCQSYSDLEIIVVDDGSKPALKIPDEISADKRVSLIRLTPNMGQSAARNAGARAARGKWLAWLDSDDKWQEDKLKLQISNLMKMGEEAYKTALATGFEYRKDNGDCDQRIPIASSNPDFFFAGNWFCPGSTILVSKTLFNLVGPYDEKMRRLEDLDWFMRMSLLGGRLEVSKKNLAIIGKGQKADYELVKMAGSYLLEKTKADKDKITSLAWRNLQAYLNLEYAASAIKKNQNFGLGVWHLLLSLYFKPRLSLHIYDFWKKE